jgi:pimeloyl-ACP methyl ester carboxylesterase
MRTTLLIVFGTLVSFAGAERVPVVAATASPCATATVACTEWVALGRGPARSLIYRTYSLDVRNDNIRRAVVMVHGTNRNADHYFTTVTAAAFLAGALDDTVVISPRFTACNDKLEPNEVGWSCNGDSWRSGGMAATNPDLSSFDFMDEIVKKLAKKSVFPNLHALVVTGHSAGGQFVARYQMSNRVHDSIGTALSYVVANPSSYAWPSPRMRKGRGKRTSHTRSSRTVRSTQARARITTVGRPASRIARPATPPRRPTTS